MAPTAATRAKTNPKERVNPSTPKAEQEAVEEGPVDVTKLTPRQLQRLKNKLRNEAERETLHAHRNEVIERTEGKFKKHGIEYVRRLSEAEKAQKEILELLEKHPELKPVFAAQLSALDASVDQGPGYPFTSEYEPVTRETIEQGPEFDGQ